MAQALRNEPLTVYGDGRQTRSFCYVDDLVEALMALMASAAEVTGPVNLGNPEELPVLDVARRVIELTGAPRASASSRCRRTTRAAVAR